jgi:membrane AbrB-like protein
VLKQDIARRVIRIVLTLVIASAGGFAAHVLHVPLPWMLGPIFVIGGACMCGAELHSLPKGRRVGQWAIGTSLGLYFTPIVIQQLVNHAGLVIGAALGSLLFGIVCALATLRLSSESVPTAFFASLPGGASEMVNLADHSGGAIDRIAAAHALRILLVITIVPFTLTLVGAHGSDVFLPLVREVDWQRFPILMLTSLGGATAFTLFRVPNAWILGPLTAVGLATAAGILLSALPSWVISGGQVLIGCSLGTRFTPTFFKAAPWFMAISCIVSLLGMALAALLAWSFSLLSGLPLPTLALATAPGGVAEMCITAQVLQLGVPLITACHVLRVAVLTFAAPGAYRLFLKRYG